MNLESIVQRGVSQKEKNEHHILKNYVESIKNGTDEPLSRARVEMQT